MSPVSHNASSRRAQVRERLLAAVTGSVDPDTLALKIDQLLAEVFEDDPVLQPQPALVDQGDEESRVVITGMGVVTPLGNDLETFWQGLAEGRSGVGPVTLCDPGDAASTIAAEVRNFDARDYMDAKEARRVSRGTQFAIAAARMALDDARLTIDDSNRYEAGALIACGSTSPPDTEAAAKSSLIAVRRASVHSISPARCPICHRARSPSSWD